MRHVLLHVARLMAGINFRLLCRFIFKFGGVGPENSITHFIV